LLESFFLHACHELRRGEKKEGKEEKEGGGKKRKAAEVHLKHLLICSWRLF